MGSRSVTHIVGLVTSKVVTSSVMLIVTLSIGRVLGPELLGRWSLIVAAGVMLHTLCVNWTHGLTVRFGREEWARSRSLNITFGTRLPILVVCMALVATLLVWSPFRWQEIWFGINPADRWLVGLFTVSLWITAEAQATVQAIDKLAWQSISGPIIAIVAIATALFLLKSPQLQFAVLAITVPSIIGWGTVWISALYVGITRLRKLWPKRIGIHLAYGLPLIPAFAFGYLSDWGDQLLLSRMTSMSEVGIFSLSYQFLVLIMAANGVITTVLLPRLISAHVERDHALQRYLEYEVPTICVLWMLGIIWFVALVPLLFSIFAGPAFEESNQILLALMVGIPSSVLTSLYTILFSIQLRTFWLSIYNFIITSTNFGVSIILIPHIGALGAAAGTALSYLLGQILYIHDQHRVIGVGSRPIWILWAAGLMVGLSQFLVGSNPLARLALAIVATAALVVTVRRCHLADAAVVRVILGVNPALGRFATKLLVQANT